MTRVKKGKHALKTRRNVLKEVKGYRFARSKKEKAAWEAIFHAGTYAFDHRKNKKSDFRKLWTVRLNAAVRPQGLSYSRFIDALKKNNISLNRKMLATLALEKPDVFSAVIEKVK